MNRAVLLASCLLLTASIARGQQVVAPVLVEWGDAAAPEGAVPADGATVLLRLSIDAEGRVTDAEVVQPASAALDQAARDAALRSRFAPATRDGVPMPSRILYEHVFAPAPLPEPPPAPPAVEVTPPARVSAPPPPAPSLEVTVRGASEAERMRESSEAVTVVETERARREAADLGEVLRRVQGVGFQRMGGLGSSTRFSVNGMTDDQIRFYLDGVPLDFTGFPNIAAVPVSFVERVELYRGVVPVRFGGDALGGAVNLVSEHDYRRSNVSASFQAGSFGTSRVYAAARHRFAGTPFVLNASAFHDYADNDYTIDLELPDERGRPRPARVDRFHDAYQAYGASVEAGLVDVPWARRLLVRLYASALAKDEQHDVVMRLPYGEVEGAEHVQGATLRYDQPLRFAPGLRLNALAAYARRAIDFLDASSFVYGWDGAITGEHDRPGEVEKPGSDSTFIEHRGLGRLGLSYALAPDHDVRLVSTINATARDGENALYDNPRFIDPARADQRLITVVTGMEHELDALDERIENTVFAKHYYYDVAAQQGTHYGDALIDEGFATSHADASNFGAGDALRVRLTRWAVAKASYEYAVRLPRGDELFGDGRTVRASYELEPEISHNGNLGAALTDVTLSDHALRGEVSGFVRASDRLIHPLILDDRFRRHENIWSTRGLGVEASAGWTSPGRYVWFDGNVTWIELRNTSTKGPFKEEKGDRVPNRPWLYANGSLMLQWSKLGSLDDELSLTWHTSYVHEFFRGWESAGIRAYKIRVDAQLLHALALTYLVREGGEGTVSGTLEVQNLTDERAYDFVGVQKPGRAFYFKATIQL